MQPDEIMRDYIQKHPKLNISEEGITKSTLTKAKRQLKDKFDGRPTKPPPNSYSLYCAELMANMKDVPSTERMVLCSQQWKLLSPKEKDAYHTKCDQVRRGRSQPWDGGTPGEPWGFAPRSLTLGPCLPRGVVLGLVSAD